jgi:UDP-N-acetylglucosamine 1-carboxyvinyltransferase (EC 2.5.1.7)
LHSAIIVGPTPLKGAQIEVPDLRAGFSYVIAALIAEGESELTGIEIIERGYENLKERLKNLGADID